MKKLGYRKSRNGCSMCKKRRVKCNEQRPCSACIRHNVPCSLVGSGLTEGSRRLHDISSSQHSSPRTQPSVVVTPSVTSEAQYPGWHAAASTRSTPTNALEDVALDVSFLHTSPPDSTKLLQESEFDEPALIDLELMHHYTAHAYNSFPHASISPTFFQIRVPRLALHHRFLLHQILAASAFHMMHITPDLPHGYHHRATHHLTKALSGIRAALAAEMTFDSATSLFAASSLLLPSTYASRQHLPPDGIIDDLVGMVALYRGIGSIQTIATKQLSKDIVREVFGDNLREPSGDEPWVTDYIEALNSLKSFLSTASNLDENVRSTAVEGAQTLLDASKTERNSDRTVVSTVEIRILYRWSYGVSDGFLQMLREGEPAIHAVFLFYCAVMHKAEENCWFLQGWAARLAEVASRTLQDTPWLEYTHWVADVVARK